MSTPRLTGEIGRPFTIVPSPEQITLTPGGAPVRAGVRVTPAGKTGSGEVRIVIGVDPDSGLIFTGTELSVDDGTTYRPGADAREDTLSFDAVVVDSAANPELSIEVAAGKDASEGPTTVAFTVGMAICAVPVRIETSDAE